LFDLDKDPDEKQNLAENPDFSEILNNFKREIDDLWKKVPARKQKLHN
jgi:hypothetical protein